MKKSTRRPLWPTLWLTLCLINCTTLAAAQTTTPPPARQRRTPHRNPAARSLRPLPVGSTVVRETIAAKSLGGAVLPFRVLLPEHYDTSARRYPVLYLLHGASGGEGDWLTRTNLALYARRYHLIVVTPGVGDSWYANSAADERARYEDAIIRDLIPYVDAKYQTIGSRYGRAIAGLSMGGFGAIKFALRYPHLFAFAASFSGAFDAPRTNLIATPTDERAELMRRLFGAEASETRRANDIFHLAGNVGDPSRLPYLYLSTGEDDPLVSVMPANPRFVDLLRARKIRFEYHERPGTHDWRFWDEEVRLALERMTEFVRHMRD